MTDRLAIGTRIENQAILRTYAEKLLSLVTAVILGQSVRLAMLALPPDHSSRLRTHPGFLRQSSTA